MSKDYMSEFLSKIYEADELGLFEERRKQLKFCTAMQELIKEVIQNEFNSNTLTALIQISAHKSKDDNIVKYLNFLGLRDSSDFKDRILKCPKGSRGITGAGKSSIDGDKLGPAKLEIIRQLFLKVSSANDIETVKGSVRKFESHDIEFFTDGIYSPLLAYLAPQFCPISNHATKEYFKDLGWDGESYCSLMDFTSLLINKFPERSYLLLDACTRENVIQFIHGVNMTTLPTVWIEKTFPENRKNNPQRFPLFLHSPQRGSDGRDTYRLVRDVKPGDIIIHLIDSEVISGVSKVKGELQTSGDDQFIELEAYTPIEPTINRNEFLGKKLFANRLLAILDSDFTMFYNRKLELNQGAYLTQGHPDLVRILNKIHKSKTSSFLPYLEKFGDTFEVDMTDEKFDLKSIRLNRIYTGPPGTGKTHRVIEDALKVVLTDEERSKVDWKNRQEVISLFEEYKLKGYIDMITFHQSYSYEDFIEGIRPSMDETSRNVIYKVEDGVFKTFVHKGRRTNRKKGDVKSSNIAIDKNRVFKISLGDTNILEESEVYEECIKNGRIALGYGEGLDFSKCSDRESIKNHLKSVLSDIKDNDYNITSVNYLKNVIQKGDIVIVSDGNHYFRAVGVVRSDNYIFEKNSKFNQQREVDWLAVFEESLPVELILNCKFSQMSIYKFSPEKLKLPALADLLETRSIERNSVFIIDEINRGNISKVFGELLTLLEVDKREGGHNKTPLTLPYSKESFTLPKNLYIFGTMNTTDRSIAMMDLALRRRFEFVEIMPSSTVIDDQFGLNLKQVFDTLNEKITVLLGRDYQVGHSYFINENIESLKRFMNTWYKCIIPLLVEYFHDEPKKLKAILGDFMTIEPSPIKIKGFDFLNEEGVMVIKPEVKNEDEFVRMINALNE